MACRPQSNPTITSSDGVPPELAVLGFQRAPAYTGQTGRRYRSDRSARGFAGVDRFDDRSRILAHSSVLARFCVNSNIVLFEYFQGKKISLPGLNELFVYMCFLEVFLHGQVGNSIKSIFL